MSEESPAPPEIPCPWCPYHDAIFKKMLTHMESAHDQRWCDLALYAPISGDGPVLARLF